MRVYKGNDINSENFLVVVKVVLLHSNIEEAKNKQTHVNRGIIQDISLTGK